MRFEGVKEGSKWSLQGQHFYVGAILHNIHYAKAAQLCTCCVLGKLDSLYKQHPSLYLATYPVA